MTVTREQVLEARPRVESRLRRTPVFSSRTLGERVFLKAELFQATGSFKARGALVKIASLGAEERARGVIAISAGNHAQAVAWAAAAEGIDALVVMWRDASEAKVAATRGYGAAVDLEAAGPTEAFERLAELQAETGRTLVHPFDDPLVQAGAGTVGLEIVEDVPGLDTIVVPVGGGGLVAGIAAAVSPDVRVVAVEPELSPALHEGLAAGEPVPVQPRSIADGLGAPFAGASAIAACAEHGVESVLVSEDEIAEAMRFLYARAKLACEPAGAAAVAGLQAGKVRGETICCVVSGGNVAAPIAAAILAGR
ncbi:MAG TPA: pyridoxal-phosphate dependent enzyme [Gaiellaceae bacterium]|nr:pyridoxal-phosphate dependent enzyme [Gaiellaceae bacterium]